MHSRPEDKEPAQRIAGVLHAAYEVYHSGFARITRRARARFEDRDWAGAQRDAGERLDLYSRVVTATLSDLRRVMRDEVCDRSTWINAKAEFLNNISARADRAFARTFFNSVTRKVFDTVGVDRSIEFVAEEPRDDFRAPGDCYTRFDTQHALNHELVRILQHHFPRDRFHDLDEDARRAADYVEQVRKDSWGEQPIERIEVVDAVFYRGPAAFLVGRICGAHRAMPLVLALRHGSDGIVIDAALVMEDDVSVLFSFTRSYFHVLVEHPADLVQFLKTIIPAKRTAELYTALGYNKHGKTELYRDLVHHLENSTDQFAIAPGDTGMVMIVFALPSYDIVFKVIRDEFTPPKATSRRDVMERYDLVFRHDRAGRLIDAQEFEHLAIAKERFSEDLLEELLEAAKESVTLEHDRVVVNHCYVERRITPLNLFLRSASQGQALAAAEDYGQAIKELAAANIFPGDLLPKNFGVTRHGRVVFYDYDELRLLEACNFRELPVARDDFEEMHAEPWFYVGPDDIFPEEFRQFLGLPGAACEAFLAEHRDLLTPAFWWEMQKRHADGDLVEILPYSNSRRLNHQRGLTHGE